MSQILDFISDSKIDIALIQETWLRKTDSYLVAQIPEYNFEVIQIEKPRLLDVGGGVESYLSYYTKINLILSFLKLKPFPLLSMLPALH